MVTKVKRGSVHSVEDRVLLQRVQVSQSSNASMRVRLQKIEMLDQSRMDLHQFFAALSQAAPIARLRPAACYPGKRLLRFSRTQFRTLRNRKSKLSTQRMLLGCIGIGVTGSRNFQSKFGKIACPTPDQVWPFYCACNPSMQLWLCPLSIASGQTQHCGCVQ